MFRYNSIKAQLMRERKLREKAQSDLQKVTADLDYVAMMSDVELETDTDLEMEGFDNGTE